MRGWQHIGAPLRIILMPLIAPPVWVSIVAGVVTGFLAYEEFHVAGKSGRKDDGSLPQWK